MRLHHSEYQFQKCGKSNSVVGIPATAIVAKNYTAAAFLQDED